METCCIIFLLCRSHSLTSWFWHKMKCSAFSLVFVTLSLWSCCRILDVWDICRPALIALGFDVKIGDVQPSCGKWTESQIECVVNEDLFPSKDSYQIHINCDRVCRVYYSYDNLHTVKLDWISIFFSLSININVLRCGLLFYSSACTTVFSELWRLSPLQSVQGE